MKQYIYKGGPYTEFRGYVFKWGKPTTVTDQGTIDALRKRQDFKEHVIPVVRKTIRLKKEPQC